MQLIKQHLASGLAVSVLMAATLAVANAQDNWLRRTELTVTEPLQIPGAVLEPGMYVMRLAGTTDRHIVQFFNEDETEIITTVTSVSEQMADFVDEVVLEFEERPANEPLRLDAWYSPGFRTGLHFLYDDEEQAAVIAGWERTRLAANDRQEGVATEQAAAERRSAQSETRSEPSSQSAPGERQARTEQQQEPQADARTQSREEIAGLGGQQQQQQQSQTAQRQASGQETLPRTATNLPLAVLIGLVAIATSLGLGIVAQKTRRARQ